MPRCAGRRTISEEVLVLHKRAIVASTAALLALFLAALPAYAEAESGGTATSIDWRLVVILSVLGLSAFYVALEFVNRGR
jgi:hypothetical protein